MENKINKLLNKIIKDFKKYNTLENYVKECLIAQEQNEYIQVNMWLTIDFNSLDYFYVIIDKTLENPPSRIIEDSTLYTFCIYHYSNSKAFENISKCKMNDLDFTLEHCLRKYVINEIRKKYKEMKATQENIEMIQKLIRDKEHEILGYEKINTDNL